MIQSLISNLNITGHPKFSRIVDGYSNVLFRSVLKTPRVESISDSDYVIYTPLRQRNLCAYLLAIKSFLRFCNDLSFSVVVQNDGTLEEHDCDTLREHIRGVQVLGREESEELLASELSSTLKQNLQRRPNQSFFLKFKLLNVLYRYRGRYVIVFDSDLLFQRSPKEVIALISTGKDRVFHLPGGNSLSDRFLEMEFAFPHVDIRSFNAGFFGVRNNYADAEIEGVIGRVCEYDMSLLSNWQIEQAIWAVLLNSCEDPLNLGELGPGYVGNGWRGYRELRAQAAVIHFVGTTRFKNLSYLLLGRKVIRELHSLS